MALEQIKSLLKALYENAALIELLTEVITEPVYYEKGNQDKTISLLKGAGIIEELDEDYYMPGEKFDSLQLIIDTSRFAASVSPDISTWIKDFRNACQDYKSQSQQEITDSSIDSLKALRKVGRLSARITSGFQIEIREIDADIGNNLNNHPSHEDKIRQSQFYLDRLSEIQNDKLTRLTYKELMKHSTCPETAKVVRVMDRKLYELREQLIRVLNRVSDFNFRVREISKRKQSLSRMYHQLSSGEIKLDAEDLSLVKIKRLTILSADDAFHFTPHLAATELERVEESVLNDLISRANLSPMLNDVVIEEMDKAVFMEERAPIDVSRLRDDYAARFAGITKNLFSKILESENPVSLNEYWTHGDFKDISPNAWLCVMGDKLYELQEGVNVDKDSLVICGVKHRASENTQIRILTDITAELRKA